jgi:transposase
MSGRVGPVVVKLSSVIRLAPRWASQLYLPPYSPDLNSIEEAF